MKKSINAPENWDVIGHFKVGLVWFIDAILPCEKESKNTWKLRCLGHFKVGLVSFVDLYNICILVVVDEDNADIFNFICIVVRSHLFILKNFR